MKRATNAALASILVLISSNSVAHQAPSGESQPAAHATLQTQDQGAHLQTAEEAVEQDAQGYATTVGVGIEEARRRIKAIEGLRPTKTRIQQAYAGRLAGIATEHSPRFQLSVLLTGDAPVEPETVTVGGLAVPIVYRTGARSTIQQLRAALKEHQATIRRLLPATQGIGISTKTGELVLVVDAAGTAAAAALARDAEFETLTGVPIRIRILEGAHTNLDVRGGSRLTDCTSGFVVKNTSGTTGVATAAHCGNTQTYYNPSGSSIPLALVAGTEQGYGSQDVQVHTSSYVERAEFYVDTAKTQVRRPVGDYTLGATWEGDNACHRGEATGASCSFVDYVYYQPPHSECAGYCQDTYVAVLGPHCRSGDSGGPVYDLSLARGLLKGGYVDSTGYCHYYYYMPMEFISSGWTLLLG